VKNVVKYAAAATALATVLAPTLALAALTAPTPPIGGGSAPVTGGTVTRLLEQIAQFVLTISVIIAVIVIVWGGIQALRGGWDKARETLTKAAIGLAIIFGVGLIMQTVARLVQTQSIN